MTIYANTDAGRWRKAWDRLRSLMGPDPGERYAQERRDAEDYWLWFALTSKEPREPES